MTLNITVSLNGKEIADQLTADILKQGINLDNVVVKCVVIKKDGAEVEIDLNNVKFVFSKN